MRIARILGLAAMAALAAMAIAGAGTAAADTACLVDTDPCPAASQYTGPIKGLDPAAKLLAGELEESCHSEFLADFVKNEGSHVGVLYLILTLTFTNCKGACAAVKGNSVEHLPFLALASSLLNHVNITADGQGAPRGTLTGCFGFATCEYEAPATSLLKYVLGAGGTGTSHFNANIKLKKVGGSFLCPAEGEWEASYTVVEDNAAAKNLYLIALP